MAVKRCDASYNVYSFNGICFVAFPCLVFYACDSDSKAREANMGPIWGRQDPGGPHVGPMNFAIWDDMFHNYTWYFCTYGVMPYTQICGHYLTNIVNL